MSQQPIKGRGAQRRVHNRFDEFSHEVLPEYLEYCRNEDEDPDLNRTRYLEVFPKSFVNKVNSPDVGMDYSANPYQGCEHGCVYCYARNSHEFWGYGAGLDFERTILVKKNAPLLLEEKLKSSAWKGTPIVLSGNTDCYQPIERKLAITRHCLEVFLKWKHPVGVITKNSLVLRDLDLLRELAQYDAATVHISLSTLSEVTRRLLEPRTASVKNRLKAVEILSKNGIPVNVMMAPIIPSLNSHEILQVAKSAADAGATSVAHTVVRLNGSIAGIFEDWARKNIPGKADRVLNQIAECHDGKLNDSRFGIRMRGSGTIARQIHDTVKMARRKYFGNAKMPPLSNVHYLAIKNPQTRLF